MKPLYYSLSVPVLVATAHGAQFLTVDQAQRSFFPGADSFVEKQLELSAAQTTQIETRSRTRLRLKRFRVWEALAHGQRMGVVIVDEVYGKHEFITYAMAIDSSGKIAGVEILTYRESYGGEVRRAQWRGQFVGKSAGDQLELDKDIRNISGATLSCQHVTEGIRRNLALYHVALANN
jgi:Na+-translocating ferredoxin:NAD+ oxidoreductase RnfG subunit